MIAILELLKANRPSAETARQTVAQLEEKSAAASAWQLQNQQELDVALLAAAEGLVDATAVAKARKAFEQARQAAQDSAGALAGARRRLADAQAAEADAARLKRWQRVQELCKRRQDYAQLIETSAATLGEQVRMLIQFSAEIAAAIPEEPDIAACMLGQGDLLNAVREQLWRHEVVQGSPWSAWELERRLGLSARIELANEYIGTMGEAAK